VTYRVEMSMPMVPNGARAGSWTGRHEHGQSSEYANLTGGREATIQ